MSLNKNYKMTIKAAYLGFVVQAIVNNFVPLLFVRMQSEFGIPLGRITLLITFNFGVQLLIDMFSAPFIEKIGYRASMLLSNACVVIGLLLLTVLPGHFASPFIGVLVSVCIYAIGGGLQEVLVSPIVEACPTENKEAAMSLLHSAYCWGHMAVVLLSTVFFAVFGISQWRIMAALWCIVPVIDFILFTKAPIARLEANTEENVGVKELFRQGIFWLMFFMMFAAGASEQAVSQWSSAFAEKGLGVSKTLGDLLGPMLDAFCILHGFIKNAIWSKGTKDKAKCIHGYIYSTLHTFVYYHSNCTSPADSNNGLWSDRTLCRDFLAGNFQYSISKG